MIRPDPMRIFFIGGGPMNYLADSPLEICKIIEFWSRYYVALGEINA